MAHNPSRIAGHDFGRTYRRANHGTGCDQRIAPDNAVGQHDCLGSDPCAAFDNDRRGDQVESATAMIVAAGAQIGALRNANMIAQANVGQVIDPNALAEPAVVANR